MTESFVDLLRAFRTRASLTQEQLAERAGISAEAVAALEQGRRTSPRLSTVSALADAMGLSTFERSQLAETARGTTAPIGEAQQRPIAQSRPSSIPTPLTPLVGRHSEVERLLHEVTTERLLTLTGAGGAGKTRLALAVAHQSADKFEGGTRWIDLSGVSDFGAVPQAVLGALGAVENPGRKVDDQVVASLPDVPVLLVLDNCEQVIDPIARLVAKLIGVPTVSVLATSRESIGIPGELVWPVTGLAVPPDDPTPEVLASIPSVELFADRAMRADPTFKLSGDTARAVVRICQRLDGMPLALELNAVRVRSMTVDVLADELERRVSLSAVSARGVPDRHATLWACIDWSYQLLNDEEQRLFRCLSLSFSPLSIDAISAIALRLDPRISGHEVINIIDRLVAKSLVVAPEREGDRGAGFRLLESLRAYSWERAQEAGELDAIRDAHGDHVLAWLESLHADEPTDATMREVAVAYPNIRAALTWSIEQRSGRCAELVYALGESWHYHSRFHDAVALGDAALRVVDDDRHRWSRAVGALSLARLLGGDLEFVTSTVSESSTVARDCEDGRTEGWSRFAQSLIAPFDQAELQAVYEIGQTLDKPSLAALAAVAASIGGVDGPDAGWLSRITELRPRLGSRTIRAMCDIARIDVYTEGGRFADALEVALPIASVPDVMPTIYAYGRIACLALLQDDADLVTLAEQIGDLVGERWPTDGHRWWVNIPRLRLALVRREPVSLESMGFSTTRLGMQPNLVRTWALALLDQGRVIDPELLAQQTEPPDPRSLMSASFDAVRASQFASTDPQAAAPLWRRVLSVSAEQDFRLLACDGLEGLGTLLCSGEDPTTGGVLLEAAEELRRQIGYRFRFEFQNEALSAARSTTGSDDRPGASPVPWREAIALVTGFGQT